jgi:hypothetical protein
MPGAPHADGTLTTNYEPKSRSRRTGDQLDEKIVIVRGALFPGNPCRRPVPERAISLFISSHSPSRLSRLHAHLARVAPMAARHGMMSAQLCRAGRERFPNGQIRLRQNSPVTDRRRRLRPAKRTTRRRPWRRGVGAPSVSGRGSCARARRMSGERGTR